MLELSAVRTEPAGRLWEVLNSFHTIGGEHSLSKWWELATEHLVEGNGDAIGLRSQAAKLLLDIENEVFSLPSDIHRPTDLLAGQGKWAKPIFGTGLTDSEDNRIGPESLITAETLSNLSVVSSVLVSNFPEYRPGEREQDLAAVVQDVRKKLLSTRREVEEAEDLPEAARARLMYRFNELIDAADFVRVRGFSALHAASEAALDETRRFSADQASASDGHADTQLTRARKWLGNLEGISSSLWRILVPPTLGVVAGLTSHDVGLGIGTAVLASSHQNKTEVLKALRQLGDVPAIEAGSNDD